MSEKFEEMLGEALEDQYYYGESGRGHTELDKPVIDYVNGLEKRIAELDKELDCMRKRFRVPTHGSCCTCQRCGQAYEDCRCSLDDAADEIVDLKTRIAELEARIKAFESAELMNDIERIKSYQRIAELEAQRKDIGKESLYRLMLELSEDVFLCCWYNDLLSVCKDAVDGKRKLPADYTEKLTEYHKLAGGWWDWNDDTASIVFVDEVK